MRKDDLPARIPEHTATDCLVRAMDDFGDEIERVVVITMDKAGVCRSLYSNARSDAEMIGMIHIAGTQFRRTE